MNNFWALLKKLKINPTLFASILLAVCCLIWFQVVNSYRTFLVNQAKTKTANELSARVSALTSSMNHRIALLEGLYAFTRTEWPDSAFDQSFEIYSAGIYFNTKGVCTLIIAPEGISRYVYPIADRADLVGYDLTNDENEVLRKAVHQTIQNQQISLTKPGHLRDECYGVTALKSVYRGSELWGLVAISLDLGVLIKDAGLSTQIENLDLSLRDSDGKTFYGNEKIWDLEPNVQLIPIPGDYWELGIMPHGGWESAIDQQLSLFRATSLLIFLLFVALFYLILNRQEQLRQAVEFRTKQILQNEKHLSTMVNERTKELSSLLNVSRHMRGIQNVNFLLEQVLAEMRYGLDYTVAAIYQRDETGDFRLVKHAGEIALDTLGSEVSLINEESVQKITLGKQPFIVPNWILHPDFPAMFCWLGVPMLVNERVTGLLVMIHKENQYYRESDKGLAMAFAQQIASALENASLYQQAGQLAIMEERQRLARELHDSVAQVLFSIGLGVKSARTALEKNPAQLVSTIDYIENLAEAGQVEMRALIFELRPEALVQEGLVSALEKQAAVVNKRHSLPIEIDLCAEPPVALPVKEAFYRIAQEAIYNIIKHARATRVQLSMQMDDKRVRLCVKDDGIGFNITQDSENHLGLRIMRERIARCNGTFKVDSQPGNGTTIEVSVPLAG